MIRVSIIAPIITVRAGLRALLSGNPQVEVVAEDASLADMSEGQVEADVLVWAPGASEDLAEVKSELAKADIGNIAGLLLIHHDPKVIEYMSRHLEQAWGVLHPESTQAELIASIQALNEGLAITNPAWLKEIVNHPATIDEQVDKLVEPLTGRETEILQLLAFGLTNKQIAARLGISAHTVKFHISTIFSKLGTTNRMETVNLGLKKGLIVL